MRRLLLALCVLASAACTGNAEVNETTSSSGTFGGFGTLGTVGGNASGSASGTGGTTSHVAASGSSGAAIGTTGTPGSIAAASSGAVSNATGTTGATIAGSGASTNGSTSSSGSACSGVSVFVGIGNGAACCAGLVASSAGYCEEPSSSSGTTVTGSTGAGATTGSVTGGGTGTTTGGACPMNVPNLATGQTTTVAGSCSDTGDNACPNGFSCVNHQCVLHGSTGPLQVTLSWDDPEDLDLHVYEPQPSQPGGYCEIFYGNVGPREWTDGGLQGDSFPGACTSIGWLDRDSNPACNFDNVDIENVIYPYSGNPPPPNGTYTVLADYYEDCNGSTDLVPDGGEYLVPEENPLLYAMQFRVDGAVYKICRSFTPSDADGSGSCMPKTDGGDSDAALGVTCTKVDTFSYP